MQTQAVIDSFMSQDMYLIVILIIVIIIISSFFISTIYGSPLPSLSRVLFSFNSSFFLPSFILVVRSTSDNTLLVFGFSSDRSFASGVTLFPGQPQGRIRSAWCPMLPSEWYTLLRFKIQSFIPVSYTHLDVYKRQDVVTSLVLFL